jgi:hypothetical protein
MLLYTRNTQLEVLDIFFTAVETFVEFQIWKVVGNYQNLDFSRIWLEFASSVESTCKTLQR